MTERHEEFTEVYELHPKRWLWLACSVAGHRRHAEDAVASAVEHVWPGFRDGRVGDVALYMRRAVINEAVKQGQRDDRERAVGDRRPAGTPATVADAVDDHHVLMRAMRRLPVEQRAAIALRYLEDLSEADIVAVLGVRRGTVKSRLHRGLLGLREVMEEVGADGR